MAKEGLMSWINALAGMFFPNVCRVCGTSLVEGEKIICLDCDIRLPRTKIHTIEFNDIHMRLASHVPIERAGGYFYYYRGNRFTRLIHSAKYDGYYSIASHLGEKYAREILPDGFFDGIDYLIPVPLHRSKFLKRGYNQSEHIALGVERVTGIPISKNLISVRRHSSQTRRNAWERWLNARNTYDAVNADMLRNRHVLIIDDVITTGSTLLACCEAIHRVSPSTKISILALGITRLS